MFVWSPESPGNKCPDTFWNHVYGSFRENVLAKNLVFLIPGKIQTQQLLYGAPSDLPKDLPLRSLWTCSMDNSVRSPPAVSQADGQTLTQGCSQIPKQVHTHSLLSVAWTHDLYQFRKTPKRCLSGQLGLTFSNN